MRKRSATPVGQLPIPAGLQQSTVIALGILALALAGLTAIFGFGLTPWSNAADGGPDGADTVYARSEIITEPRELQLAMPHLRDFAVVSCNVRVSRKRREDFRLVMPLGRYVGVAHILPTSTTVLRQMYEWVPADVADVPPRLQPEIPALFSLVQSDVWNQLDPQWEGQLFVTFDTGEARVYFDLEHLP